MTSPEELAHVDAVAKEWLGDRGVSGLTDEFTDMLLDQRTSARLDMRDSVLQLLRSYDAMDTLPMTAEVLLVTLIERIQDTDFGVP